MTSGHAQAALKHHPSEATLLAHIVGALGPAHDLVVAAHLALCPYCTSRKEVEQEVGGRLLEALPPTPLAPDAVERAMRELDAPDAGGNWNGESIKETPHDGAGLPVTLHAMMRTARLRWLAPGARQAMLLQQGNGTLRLIRVAPGRALPRHGHRGVEMTLVLEGAFTDERGRYGPGDLAEADEALDHRPVAEGPAECVCLIATLGRLHFKGVFGGLIGRAFG